MYELTTHKYIRLNNLNKIIIDQVETRRIQNCCNNSLESCCLYYCYLFIIPFYLFHRILILRSFKNKIQYVNKIH